MRCRWVGAELPHKPPLFEWDGAEDSPLAGVQFWALSDTSVQQFIQIKGFVRWLQNESAWNYRDVFLDLPASLHATHAAFVASFPSPVVLTQKKWIKSGFLKPQRNESHRMDSDDFCEDIWIADPLEARRALAHFWPQPSTLWHWVGSMPKGERPPEDMSDEDALREQNGLLWLAARWTKASAKRSDCLESWTSEALGVLWGHVRKPSQSRSSSSKILFMLDVMSFQSIVKYLEDWEARSQGGDANGFEPHFVVAQLKRKREESKKERAWYRLESKSAAELIPIPAAVSNTCLHWPDLSQLKGPRAYESLESQALLEGFQACASRYFKSTHLEISSTQKIQFFQYLNRLCLLQRQRLPSPFLLSLAAQGTVDGAFAWEWAQYHQEFTPSSKKTGWEEVRCELQDIFPNTMHLSLTPFVSLHQNRLRRQHLRAVSNSKWQEPEMAKQVALEEDFPDDSWCQDTHSHLCSFPTEDIYLEQLVDRYKKGVQEQLKVMQNRSVPLTSHMGEGLDLKSTLRSLLSDKIYVFENAPGSPSDLGSVILQFSHASHDYARFSWKSIWYAEPHDESHMMFYATPPQQNILGPGIARCELGGCAFIPKGFGFADPWQDPFLTDLAYTPSEVLLLAGALSSKERNVLYVAPEPPSTRLLRSLQRSQKFVIYRHLDSLPIDVRQRLRFFHILANPGVRSYAHKYILTDYKGKFG